MTLPDAKPLTPPLELSARIGGAAEDYHRIGSGHAVKLRALLPANWEWAGKRVLDFGCGTGRTLVQFREEAESGDFYGCDIDEPSLEWASANLSPPFRFVLNGPLPPVDLPLGSFDLVYGFSVFTHLVETWSSWLLEVHRLLRVGGYAFFTFLGEGMIEEVAGHPWDEQRIGMIGLDIGKPWSIGGPTVLHSEWWLRAHWGCAFEVVDVIPVWDPGALQGQGMILLRKDERELPTQAQLERLWPDEPREIRSLQFAVQLLGERSAKIWRADTGLLVAENDHLRAKLGASEDKPRASEDKVREAVASADREVTGLTQLLEQYRVELASVQRSLSWRLTAPLRVAKRVAKRAAGGMP